MIIVLAPYFLGCISEHDLDELNVEIIRNTLYKVKTLWWRTWNCFEAILGLSGRFLQLLSETRWCNSRSDV